MSRTIKFRAWDGSSFYTPIIDNGKFFRDHRDYEDGNDCPDDVIQQFTGLTDKNGKEVYEGDLLALPGNFSKYRYVVAFEDYKFIANHVNKGWGKWGDLHRFGELNTGKDKGDFDIEVIGNIYENPELLATPSKTN